VTCPEPGAIGSDAKPLEQWQFRPIAVGGFGDSFNAYAHTMAWFKDALYVGTTRANLCLLKNRLPLDVESWPVNCPDDVYQLDLRAQIWSFDPRRAEWRQAFVAPVIAGKDGQPVARELGYRGMTVFQGPRDREPALYVATWAPSKARGPLVLRSEDGYTFTSVSQMGLADPTVSAFRSLVSFNGRLYITPVGRAGGKPNTPDNPVVMQTDDPVAGAWRVVSVPGFGDAGNLTVFEMVGFNGFLYAGTLNPQTGFQVWKTRGGGTSHVWQRVMVNGADRGPLNEAVVSMTPFRGALYVGSGIQNGGFDRTHDVGPAAAELIRIHPDDSWDLVVGEPRRTAEGLKRPLADYGSGFDDLFNGYFWRMAEYDGVLYLGTFKWSSLLPYLQLAPRDLAGKVLRRLGVENITNFDSGFDLFSSPDGLRWSPVTTSGFGNPYNFGARTLVGTPYGLFVGTANPFGPEVAARTLAGWSYVPNPRGGAEIWLGAQAPAGLPFVARTLPAMGS